MFILEINNQYFVCFELSILYWFTLSSFELVRICFTNDEISRAASSSALKVTIRVVSVLSI